MTTAPEQLEMRPLRDLVEAIGLAHVVYLLAQIADEETETARLKRTVTRATRCEHDARLPSSVAIRMLE
jgi:hypothetical protein